MFCKLGNEQHEESSLRTVLMRQACLSHCNLDWWNREPVTLSRPHGAILSDLQSLAQSAQGPLSTPTGTVPSKMGNKFCNFFIWMNFFRLAWQCLSNSLYYPGAPKAFPGLLNRSWWPTLQKSISLHLCRYVLTWSIISWHFWNSGLFLICVVKLDEKHCKYFQYLWIYLVDAQSKWEKLGLWILCTWIACHCQNWPPPTDIICEQANPLEKRCLQKYLFPFTFHCWYW